MRIETAPRPRESAPPPALPSRKRLNLVDFMQGGREIVLVHNGEEYLLRITRAGKLILTK